ncbi:nitrilotriacetate monooxygenase [Methylovirgula ligni]|uniref:FMN-dependent oxidoreductase (Nitrilotriacetate monooxygenase family) n=1 Tax=Methylovirgula ligni TaxID=569860 RepID=A0A3D9YT49_9HYPH|nr:LLM class flavin-dependent oxidoreductase [Methylovirgula ligni]QAY97396.1 nitrilotriacetate monooxygenase [Methylovirgula ligni]REF84062.1 FMN-dependent oxidoreductase (nitrilotriacetate monooxygenase family) [Methylovirgula ligni]
MGARPDQLKLGLFLNGGHHSGGWRHPDANANTDISFADCARLVQKAERGKFDLLFLADFLAADAASDPVRSKMTWAAYLEPLTLLSALSAATTHIGLVGTATTSYNEPFHVARKFASLDHISSGRAGWNLVTTVNGAEAQNFNRNAHFAHADRYQRAEEFVDVVFGLWDSWDDDAFVRDKVSGRYYEPEKVHVLDHRGQHFSVRGPLNIARPPQGRPVIVQAGSSEPGKELAARTAEVIFTAQNEIGEAQDFYADVKGRMTKFGRSPDQLKILPGLSIIVGRTEQQAADKLGLLQSLTPPEVGARMLSSMLDIDLSGYSVDGPLPDVLPPTNGGKARQALIAAMARRENLTIRDLYSKMVTSRGHGFAIGSVERVADYIQEWFESYAFDGFNFMPPWLDGGLNDFVDLVVPELQRRGILRREYEGRTLRENLGLERPESRYADSTHISASQGA